MEKKCPKSKQLGCWCGYSTQERFQHFMPSLKALNESDPRRRVALLQTASPCLIRLLSECGLNVLKGNVKLSDSQYASLRPHRRMLMTVSKPSASLEERRHALTRKKGGFLPIVLPIILSALSGFAGQAVAKAVGIL